METLKKQRGQRIGAAGSLINQLLSHNDTAPCVGKGATILHYTDRSVAEVVEVSDDGNTAVIEHLNAAADPALLSGSDYYGHQNWIFAPSGNRATVTWRNGRWNYVSREIVFTGKYKKSVGEGVSISAHLRKTNPDIFRQIYGDNIFPAVVVPGITRERTVYTPVSILWGVKDYYYDWSF